MAKPQEKPSNGTSFPLPETKHSADTAILMQSKVQCMCTWYLDAGEEASKWHLLQGVFKTIRAMAEAPECLESLFWTTVTVAGILLHHNSQQNYCGINSPR